MQETWVSPFPGIRYSAFQNVPYPVAYLLVTAHAWRWRSDLGTAWRYGAEENDDEPFLKRCAVDVLVQSWLRIASGRRLAYQSGALWRSPSWSSGIFRRSTGRETFRSPP